VKRVQYVGLRCYLQDGGGFKASAVFEWCEDVGTEQQTDHKKRGDSDVRSTPGEAMGEALQRVGFYE